MDAGWGLPGETECAASRDSQSRTYAMKVSHAPLNFTYARVVTIVVVIATVSTVGRSLLYYGHSGTSRTPTRIPRSPAPLGRTKKFA